jgi:hypothetical protein
MTAPAATLIAAGIAAVVLLYVHRLNSRRAASQKFRASILNTLSGLYPIPSKWPDGLDIDVQLRSVFPQVQSAVEEFRPFVPWYRRGSFEKAWFLYRLGDGGREIDKQCYHQYMAFGDNPTFRENFKRNVDHLLRFA